MSFTVAEKAITNNEVRETYGEIQPDADGLVNITNAHTSQSNILVCSAVYNTKWSNFTC